MNFFQLNARKKRNICWCSDQVTNGVILICAKLLKKRVNQCHLKVVSQNHKVHFSSVLQTLFYQNFPFGKRHKNSSTHNFSPTKIISFLFCFERKFLRACALSNIFHLFIFIIFLFCFAVTDFCERKKKQNKYNIITQIYVYISVLLLKDFLNIFHST